MLESNIQIALKSGGIDLEDAIDLREINNITLANQMLKQRRRAKQKKDQQMQQANIAAQGKAQAETAEKTAMAEVQKQQAIAQTKVQIEQAKSQFEIDQMQQKAQIDRELMEIRYNYDMQLKKLEVGQVEAREKFIEDRKDQRTRLEGTQQSEMINQRKNNTLPINFAIPKQEVDQVMENIDVQAEQVANEEQQE